MEPGNLMSRSQFAQRINVTTANASSASPAAAAGGGDVAAAASAAVEASSSDAAAAASSSSHNTVADGGSAVAGVGGMKDDKDLALLPGTVKTVYYVTEHDIIEVLGNR